MTYQEAIRKALQQRYHVDLQSGIIHGPKGPLKIALRGTQRYPTVSLSLAGEKQQVVPAHKVVAYALYGESAFQKGIVVRHLDGNTMNLQPSNLVLGSHSDNNLDKHPEVRSRAARRARAAQGSRPLNAMLTPEQVQEIRRECLAHLNPNGRLIRGVGKRLATKYGMTTAAITAIWKGRNYNDLRESHRTVSPE